VLHLPVEPRRFWPGEILRSASGLPLCQSMSSLVRSFVDTGPGRSTKDRMQRLGRYLTDIGLLGTDDFSDLVTAHAIGEAERTVAHLERTLAQRPDASGEWMNDVRRYIDRLEHTITVPTFGIPVDLQYDRPAADALQAMRTLVRRFGELLEAWPAIVRAAADVGVRPRSMAL
jgi:hypothetical protein